MKLAISTLGCPGYSLEKAVGLISSCNVEGIEIRGIGGELLPENMECFNSINVGHSKELMKKHGLSPVVFGSSINLHSDTDILTEGIKAFELCSAVGIPAVRVFGNKLPKDRSQYGKAYEHIIDSIDSLCRAANDYNVSVYLEVHGDFNSIESLSPIVDSCTHNKNFAFIWDIAHTKGDYFEFLDYFYPYMAHIHFKDEITGSDGKKIIKLPGQGSIPLGEILRAVEMKGYSGYYSFEWEKLWHSDIEEPEIAFPYFVEYIRGLI